MGDKNAARLEMKKAKLPVIPGSTDVVVELSEAKSIAKKIGYPVILKAVSGGGGRGMRIVRAPNHMDEQLSIAQYEAKAAFGDPSLYMEKYITNAHHIEIQIVGDTKGHVIALGERECSVQRKHQKVLEETPSPFIDEKLRKRIIKAAQDAAVSIGYQSLGTFEFLVDRSRSPPVRSSLFPMAFKCLATALNAASMRKTRIRLFLQQERSNFSFFQEDREFVWIPLHTEDGPSLPTTTLYSQKLSPKHQPGEKRSERCKPLWR
jgi:acetyl/propionyl-CoA carboxylase alpha subunit